MKTKLIRQSDSDIRYFRFLNNTLQITKLREEICDEFARKIFDYLEGEPLFDAHVFCALIHYLVSKSKLIHITLCRKPNPIEMLRFAYFKNEVGSLFYSPFTLNFNLETVNPNQFQNFGIKEKLNHLLSGGKPSGKNAKVEIILPEYIGGNNVVPFVSLNFSIPNPKIEQKLDIIHFVICALNYLSQKNDPFSYSSETEKIKERESFQVISKTFADIRNSVIQNAIREKESGDEELDKAEFDPNEPTTARILQAQNQDPIIEKQWLDKNSPVFVKSEMEAEEIDLDENLKITLSARQWVILFRYFINHYKDYPLRDIDITAFARLLAVMNGGKNQKNYYDNLRNQRGLITAKTREQAQEVANICRSVGFSKIADEIERDIGKVKTNYL